MLIQKIGRCFNDRGKKMKLYIIGNGFDKAHELECSYWAFGDFIQEHYPQYYSCLMAAFNNDSGIWGDFETALPRCGSELENTGLNMMEERLGEIDYTPTDDEGIRFWLKEQYVFFRKLPVILREWVEYMCQKNVSPTYRPGVIDKDSLFLNFNYTRTLEKYYGIASDQICHIHGDVGNPEEILIMGHGSQKSIDYALKSLSKNIYRYEEIIYKYFDKNEILKIEFDTSNTQNDLIGDVYLNVYFNFNINNVSIDDITRLNKLSYNI